MKLNILANYASQIYVTFISIAAVPAYLHYMDREAYGLVGFFAAMQVWFNLLDIGLTPTVARETARFRGGALDAMGYRRLLRMLQVFFVTTAMTGGLAMILAADIIATRWLVVENLPLVDVETAVRCMAAAVALRWVAGLYRGTILGSERQVWLGVYNSLFATLRFLGVLPILMFVSTGVETFFAYQLALAAVELAGLALMSHRLSPSVPPGERIGWSVAPVKGILKFSLTIAFTGTVWTLVTQLDKLLLSKLLPLTEYACFTLAVVAAGGVTLIGAPVSVALLPRLAKLSAAGDEAGLVDLYRKSTQWVTIICAPTALTLACFAEQALWAWTGDAAMAHKAAPILRLYALGNGILVLAAFPYYLQFAKGDLKLHLLGNVLFVLFLVPSLVWAAWRYGAFGAGCAWVALNAAYFVFWVPLVHARLVRGMHVRWLWRDVVAIALPALVGAALLHGLLEWPQQRAPAIAMLACVSVTLLAASAAGSSWARRHLAERVLLPALNGVRR